jgi:hypothetical protein
LHSADEEDSAHPQFGIPTNLCDVGLAVSILMCSARLVTPDMALKTVMHFCARSDRTLSDCCHEAGSLLTGHQQFEQMQFEQMVASDGPNQATMTGS